MSLDRVYTVAEVAALLQMTDAQVKSLVYRQQIPHLRLNRNQVRFTQANVDAIARLFEVAPAQAPRNEWGTKTRNARRRRTA